MTKDIEIVLADRILNTTIKKVLPVTVWKKTINKSVSGLSCRATVAAKMSSGSIHFVNSSGSAKANVSLTARLVGTAKCNGIGTGISGSVKFSNVYIKGKVDPNVKNVKFTVYGARATITVKAGRITIWKSSAPVDLSFLNQTIALPNNRVSVKVPQPSNKNLTFRLKNTRLDSKSGAMKASADIRV